MPTDSEITELIYNCYWVWTIDYNGTGIMGYIVYKAKSFVDKGKKIYDYDTQSSEYTLSDNHIFLPAAGYRFEAGLTVAGTHGLYWSSSLDGNSNYAMDLGFNSSDVRMYNLNIRCSGRSVRAVCP